MSDIPQMLFDLERSPAFRRIRRVSFLGIVDYVNQHRGRPRPAFSRAEHSLGVLKLGLVALKHMRLSDLDAAHLVAACMVHDLGHPPFSHSLEYAFPKSVRTVTHHQALREMLLHPRGGERLLPRILNQYGVSPQRVFEIVDGVDPLSFVFTAPVNIDTLDGISRSMDSFGIFWSYDTLTLSQFVGLLYAGGQIKGSDQVMEMDKFWRQKALFYKVLSSENPLSLAERRFQRVVRHHLRSLSVEHFRMTDREFITRYPQIMTDFNHYEGPETIAPVQDFDIVNSVRNIDKNSVYDRYVRTKHAAKRHRAIASQHF